MKSSNPSELEDLDKRVEESFLISRSYEMAINL